MNNIIYSNNCAGIKKKIAKRIETSIEYLKKEDVHIDYFDYASRTVYLIGPVSFLLYPFSKGLARLRSEMCALHARYPRDTIFYPVDPSRIRCYHEDEFSRNWTVMPDPRR